MIAGYFGFSNTGDELILAALLQDLRMVFPEASFVVVSGNPDDIRKNHLVESIPFNDVQRIIKTAASVDFVIMGGGGIFHDYWGIDTKTIFTSAHIGIPFYTTIALLASINKIPLMLSAVGVGPIATEEAKLCVRSIAEIAAIITVRDQASAEHLIVLGILPEKISCTADLVFNLTSSFDDRTLFANESKNRLMIGITLRNWDVGVDPVVWERQVADGIDCFLDNHLNFRGIFVPFQDSDDQFLNDFGVSRRVSKLLRNSNRMDWILPSTTFSQRASALAHCDVVLGMRLHSLIVASMNKVPVVALQYDLKIKNIMAQLGMEDYVLDLNDISGASLLTLLEKAYQNRSEISNQLLIATAKLGNLAKRNALHASEFIEKKYAMPQLSPSVNPILADTILHLSQIHDVEINQIKELQTKLIQLKEENTHHKDSIHNLEEEATRSKNSITVLEEENSSNKKSINNLQEDFAKLGVIVDNEDSAELDITSDINPLFVKLNEKLKNKNQIIKRRDIELESIKKSRGWKLLWLFWQIRLAIIPKNSIQEKLIHNLFSRIKRLPNKIKYLFKRARQILYISLSRISRYAYSFLEYKKRRHKNFPANLSGLKVPFEPGLVSIVLPVHNGDRYIREAIESILNQTYPQFELIIIDDGSTDETGRIIDAYEKRDSRIHVFHQSNQKLPQSLNNGFKKAVGEYLTWTSDDNRLKPDFLEKMVSCLSKHPSWDMIYANMDIIGEDGLPLKNSSWYSGYHNPFNSEHVHLPTNTAELNTWPNNFIGGAFLYRSYVNNLLAGYNTNQYTREDYDYWMQINSLFTIKHVNFNTPVYDYRFHSESLTHHDEELKITSDRKFLMIFDNFRRDFNLMPLVWILDDNTHAPYQKEIIETLRKVLTHRGQTLLTTNEIQSINTPQHWLPCVFLSVSEDPVSPPDCPSAITDKCIKAILCTSTAGHFENLYKNWDMGLSLGPLENLSVLAGGSNRWWASTRLDTLLTAVDIRCRSIHVQKIEKQIPEPQLETPQISVVICTYNRNQVLEKSLRAITDQTINQREYEILIVDNNPDGKELLEFIAKFRNQYFYDNPDTLRLVHCPLLGLSYARNAGISEAKGEILLFLDDDSVAKKDILEQYIKAFSENPKAGVIGGHIFLQRPEVLSMVWKDGWENYWSHFVTGHPEYATVQYWWEFPWGANWCARKKALFQIGGFRIRYGRQGNNFSGGEEIVASSLIQKLGYTIAILPQAEVIHLVDQSRFTLKHLKHTIYSGMFVHYQTQLDLYLPFESGIKNILEHSRNIPGKAVRYLLHPKDAGAQANMLETFFIVSGRFLLMFRQMREEFKRLFSFIG